MIKSLSKVVPLFFAAISWGCSDGMPSKVVYDKASAVQDIKLQAAGKTHAGADAETQAFAWSLKIPTPYVGDWKQRSHIGERRDETVILKGKMDPDTFALTPYAPNERGYRNGFQVKLVGAVNHPNAKLSEQCLSLKQMKDRRTGNDNARACTNPAKCLYLANRGRWTVDVKVDSQLGDRSNAGCEAIMSWIDSMTISRGPTP